ncbi:MAG: SMP-30/gluconolactonase/LRE family protein [Planctomycetes bacterium]|nr:SMP-30/gluconolactonase/LRE family protein [Planctomycetota bacterium]
MPGTEIQVAVFGINGPISDPPANYVWVRGARVELFRPPEPPRIERADARFDAVVPPGSTVEKVAGGFTWVEGPVWDPKGFRLLFSDIPRNGVFAWRQGAGTELLLEPSGYTGAARFAGREPGSNGLALDPEGRLLLCQHGDRRVARLGDDGTFAVVADRYEGKRLNSPNDLAFGPNGDLYFTDPPFGLPGALLDPARELPWCGVYRVDGKGVVTLLTKELSAPNGLAFSPDGRDLVVSNADPARPLWMSFPVREDGTLGEGRVLADAKAWAKERPGAPDGMKFDRWGNLFAAGPGGLYVFASDGTHLGTIVLGVPTSNCAFGADGKDLYITADTSIYRLRLSRRAGG